MITLESAKIAVVGLGYVGLPLAVEFSKKYPTVAFDINQLRVEELKNGYDSTLELTQEEMANSRNLIFTSDEELLKAANVFVVTVPTPVDQSNLPDLKPLRLASELLGNSVSRGAVVVYESTVYPGATEDECIPLIEKISGLKLNEDFYAGYSPERINPGDKTKRLKDIVKVTSGSTPEAARFVDELYSSIISVGTFMASSIRVAEASKIIENVQRDVNIALVNELYQIFTNMNIDTSEVLKAAGTKWNFMRVKPGLVGGHCIGVDPYYLMHKSGRVGYIPDLMRKGREINDGMPAFIVNDFVRQLIRRKISPVDLSVAILGFTFKEDCPDIRNTKVVDLYKQLQKYGFNVSIYDPIANPELVANFYGLKIANQLEDIPETVAVLAVGHFEILALLKRKKFDLLYDFKGLYS
jgi:UDP-N-acetyl-D-galactosamine dehydrogenase